MSWLQVALQPSYCGVFLCWCCSIQWQKKCQIFVVAAYSFSLPSMHFCIFAGLIGVLRPHLHHPGACAAIESGLCREELFRGWCSNCGKRAWNWPCEIFERLLCRSSGNTSHSKCFPAVMFTLLLSMWIFKWQLMKLSVPKKILKKRTDLPSDEIWKQSLL